MFRQPPVTYRNQRHIDDQRKQKQQHGKKPAKIPDIQQHIGYMLASQSFAIKPGLLSFLLMANLLGLVVLTQSQEFPGEDKGCSAFDENNRCESFSMTPKSSSNLITQMPEPKVNPTVKSAFQALIARGGLQHSPTISFKKCKKQAGRHVESAAMTFPDEQRVFIKVLQSPNFFIWCLPHQQHRKNLHYGPSVIDEISKLSVSLLNENNADVIALNLPVPHLGLFPIQNYTVGHEFRHSYVFLRNKAQPCWTADPKSSFVPLNPYNKDNEQLFYANVELGKNRIRHFMTLLNTPKAQLSKKQEMRLNAYKEAVQHVSSLLVIETGMTLEDYISLQPQKAGEQFPNVKHLDLLAQTTVQFEKSPGKFTPVTVDIRVTHIYMRNGAPAAVIDILDPVNRLLKILDSLNSVAIQYDKDPLFKIAEFDTHLRQNLPRKTFSLFFKELHRYDRALDNRCFSKKKNVDTVELPKMSH